MTITGYPEIVEEIKNWSGCGAEPWDYTTLHDWFRIKLGWSGQEPCAALLLLQCYRVSFVNHWEGFNPTIAEYSGKYGKRYRVTDGNYMDVDCRAFSLSRHGSYAEIPTFHQLAQGKAAAQINSGTSKPL